MKKSLIIGLIVGTVIIGSFLLFNLSEHQLSKEQEAKIRELCNKRAAECGIISYGRCELITEASTGYIDISFIPDPATGKIGYNTEMLEACQKEDRSKQLREDMKNFFKK